ncbi:MAG: hypothetical protein K8T90_10880 [Planctomycetes bacterium]|nr:hypothetical protein [Planctomycetota bacterium]
MTKSIGAVFVALGALGLATTLAIAGGDPPKGIVRPADPPTNPATAAKIALGAKLFADVRLSVDDHRACATCHVAELAFTDGLALSHGFQGKELARNAPTVLNVSSLPALFWDGRAASLEEQARLPILNPDEMAMPDEAAVAKKLAAIPEYPPLFEKAFGDSAVTLQRVARAIAAFERTLLAGDAPFDRWWRGDATAIDESAQRGYRLFVGDAGCSQCHSIRQSYATFTDGDFHNTGAGHGAGLADRGRAAITGRKEDERAFRTPGLRNVALTAPYMHDGSLATLDDVVEFYVKGGVANANLSPLVHELKLGDAAKSDLVAFLKALTSATLPQLDECDRLLEQGRPREAFDAYRRELDERHGGDRAILGMARAAVALAERVPLLDVEQRIRRRLADASPGRAHDAEPPVIDLLIGLADVTAALAPLEDAMALAREDDLLALLRRIRAAAPDRDDVAVREAVFLERRARADEGLGALGDRASPVVRVARASIRFRRGWVGFSAGAPTEREREDLRFAADEFDALRAAGTDIGPEPTLFRALALHWLGDAAQARAAYGEAARLEIVSEKALRGLRSLLAKNLTAFRADLATLLAERPDSPAVLFAAGWESFQQDRLDEASALLRRRLALETTPAAGTRVVLARIERKRGRRAESLAEYTAALGIDPAYGGLVTEIETYLRERVLSGFADVDALVAEYESFLDAGPDEPRFQAVTRNNLAFLLRDVAASYTSRGPARLHVFADGAPPKAHDVLRTSLTLYEEAAALVPGDAADLPFKERWVYAGVWNDLGLMLHYFPEIQDLDRAERCYLKAFELTDGAYQDAYFYNLQFLYGFELSGTGAAGGGRDELWLQLATRAKDRILKEDATSASGFSPDAMKRAAARRDFERLTAKLHR